MHVDNCMLHVWSFVVIWACCMCGHLSMLRASWRTQIHMKGDTDTHSWTWKLRALPFWQETWHRDTYPCNVHVHAYWDLDVHALWGIYVEEACSRFQEVCSRFLFNTSTHAQAEAVRQMMLKAGINPNKAISGKALQAAEEEGDRSVALMSEVYVWWCDIMYDDVTLCMMMWHYVWWCDTM